MFNEIAFAAGARMPLIIANAAINNTVFFMMFILDTMNLDEGECFLFAAIRSHALPPMQKRSAARQFRQGGELSRAGYPPTFHVPE